MSRHEAPIASANPTPPSPLLDAAASFRRHLRAANLSPMTAKAYLEAVGLFDGYVDEHYGPLALEDLRREHVEFYVEDQLARRKGARREPIPQGAALLPLARGRGGAGAFPDGADAGPRSCRSMPPAVLRDDDLRRLLGTSAAGSFQDRRDTAIIRVFIDIGARLSEVAGLRGDPHDDLTNDVHLDQGVLRIHQRRAAASGSWRSAPRPAGSRTGTIRLVAQ